VTARRAGTTQRHLSFIERGRSRPGRAIVVRLAESLGLTLRERNRLLLAAPSCTSKRFSRPMRPPPPSSVGDERTPRRLGSVADVRAMDDPAAPRVLEPKSQ
jgi:transcriptional regulator with XRE-family HTH domain